MFLLQKHVSFKRLSKARGLLSLTGVFSVCGETWSFISRLIIQLFHVTFAMLHGPPLSRWARFRLRYCLPVRLKALCHTIECDCSHNKALSGRIII